MVRQYYDPNKNIKLFRHTSSIVFIGYAFIFYYNKNPITFIVSDILFNTGRV